MSDNRVDLEIIRVDDPWRFLAREKPESAKSREAQEFQQMYQKMNEYCQQCREEGLQCYRPRVGDICAAANQKDGLWHRVRVESQVSQSHGQQYYCYMIDRGSQLIVSPARLLKLTKDFLELPGQVHQCCLWEVQPLTLHIVETDTGLSTVTRPCNKWDPAAVDFMQRMVDESDGCQADIVHQDSQNTRYLRLYFTTGKRTVCFNEVLISQNYAVRMNISEAILSYERLTKSSTMSDYLTSLTAASTEHPAQFRPDNMPDLVPCNDRIDVIRNKNICDLNSVMDRCCIKNKEVSAQCLQRNESFQEFCFQNKTESNMKDTVRKLQSAGISTESQSFLRLKGCRAAGQQPQEDSCQRSQVRDRDSWTPSSSCQAEKLDTFLKLATEVTEASLPKAALSIFPDVRFGRGRGLLLTKDNSLAFPGFAFGLQRKQSCSPTNLPIHADAVEMPPLISENLDPYSESELLPDAITMNENPLNDRLIRESSTSHISSQNILSNHSSLPLRGPSGDSLASTDACWLSKPGFSDLSSHMEVETELVDVPIVPRKPNLPVLNRRDKPLPRLVFGVLVNGRSQPSPVCDVADVPFEDSVKAALLDMDIDVAKSIQAFVWPAVLCNRHVVGICPPRLGKTMSYVPALISLLLDKIVYLELPPGKGPLAVIIVPSWRNARDVYEMIECVMSSDSLCKKKIKAHLLYAGGQEEKELNQISLLQGCDILIATPHSLIRMLDQNITSLKRLCHIILDDADILAARFFNEVETIMQRYMLHLKDRKIQKKCLDVPRQVLIFASCWTRGIDDFYSRYTKEAIVAISSRVEASVYGGVRQTVILTKWDQRLATFCNLLSSLSSSHHRVAVFSQHIEDAQQLYQAARSISIYCLLIHEDLPSEAVAETRTQWIHSSQSRKLLVLVCTDQCYQDLAITNATMVVHYGLPDSKTKFGNRLACMFDYFIDRTASTKPELEPLSQVILTNRCADRAESLFEILQRCPADYSPHLQRFLSGYKMSVENSERKVLCPLLKSFGACNLSSKCSNRHVMIPGQDLKTGDSTHTTLPSSGEVKIKVIYVENASHYYCHLLEHRSVPGNIRTDLRLEYQRLFMELVAFFSKETNHVPYMPSEEPFLDGICAFRDSDSIFYRAKVLEVRKKSIAAPTECKLWLVDAGHHKTATIDQLMKLPENLAQIPYQAVEIYLCCVKPMDDDAEWTIEANTFINDLVHGKELVGRIMLSLGLTLWLLPLVHQVTLKSVGVANDINVKQEMLDHNFATPNQEHIQSLFELFRGKIEIPEKLMRRYFEYTLEMEMKQETLSESERFHEVSIAAVISPDLFYLHKWENFEHLEALETKIAELVKQQEDSGVGKHKADTNMELGEGDVCLARSTDKWYRAKIVAKLTSGKWLVFFLDYGDKGKIARSNVRPLPRELAELPCQAIECQLAYIQPPGAKWDRQAAETICDLSYFVNEEKKQLFAKVVNRADAEYGMGQKLVVDLWNSDTQFSQELVWRVKACYGQESEDIQNLLEKPALKSQLFFNKWDKIAYLCGNIYWCQNTSDAIMQASELRDILSCRDEGWDADLLQRGTLSAAFRVVGYLSDTEAHGILLDSLVMCCLDSDSVTELAIQESFLYSLAFCFEQASRPCIQHQAVKALAKLVTQESLLQAVTNCGHLVSVLHQFLCRPLTLPVDFEILTYLCSIAARMVYAESESKCGVLSSSEMVEHIFSALRQTPGDAERQPWLELLAAIATRDSCHSCLMREAHVLDLMHLLKESSCQKCLYHLMSVCASLVKSSRRHKLMLLENKLMIILHDLEAGGLRSPCTEACQQLKQQLSLTLPQPETLTGVSASLPQEVTKIVSPQVTWSQNCFRVVLTVQVRCAKVEDFCVSESRISCRQYETWRSAIEDTGKSEHDGVQSQLDWELYESIVPELSKVCVYTSYSLVSLHKQTNGQWSRLLKQKVKPPNLSLDFEHPYNSDDEDVEDDENMMKLTQKRNLLCQEQMLMVKTLRTFSSSDESGDEDELAWNSDSSNEDPAIDLGPILANAAEYSPMA